MRPVFVAPKAPLPKQTAIITQDISHKRRFSIEASQTLSEKPVIINRWKNLIGLGSIVLGQALRLPVVILSATEAVALQTRSHPAAMSTQLFLFPKLDFLAQQLRIADVLCQERNDRS